MNMEDYFDRLQKMAEYQRRLDEKLKDSRK
jgi:hypothetical protein